MSTRIKVSTTAQTHLYSIIWRLRDASKKTVVDHAEIKRLYEELIWTFDLTDDAMVAARPLYARHVAEAAQAAEQRAEEKQRREHRRRERIMAQRAATSAQGETGRNVLDQPWVVSE